MSGQVFFFKAIGEDLEPKNGATVTIEVEGLFAGSTKTSGGGKYRITFSHPGTYKATASLAGFRDDVKEPARSTENSIKNDFFVKE